jgi:hypothetical protein
MAMTMSMFKERNVSDYQYSFALAASALGTTTPIVIS